MGRAEFQGVAGGATVAVAGVFWPSQGVLARVAPTERRCGQACKARRCRRRDGRPREASSSCGITSATPTQRPNIDRALACSRRWRRNCTRRTSSSRSSCRCSTTPGTTPPKGCASSGRRPGRICWPSSGPRSSSRPRRRRRGRYDGGGQRAGSVRGRQAGVTGSAGSSSRLRAGSAKLLNLTTWYLMKDRVGEGRRHRRRRRGPRAQGGTADRPDSSRRAQPGRAAAWRRARRRCAAGHGAARLAVAARSRVLALRLQPEQRPRQRRASSATSIAQKVVKGPFVSTYSVQDTVVGYAYAIASRLAGDNAKAIGDKDEVRRHRSQRRAAHA